MANNPRNSKAFKGLQAKVAAGEPSSAIKNIIAIIRRFRNLPYFILLTSICQIALFFWYYSTETRLFYKNKNITMPITMWNYCGGCSYFDGCKLNFGLDFIWELRGVHWTVWTYQFAHEGIIHLLGNVGIQCIVGVPLEKELGTALVAVLYTMGVLSWPLLALNPGRILFGPSNGVGALLAASLMINYEHFVNGNRHKLKFPHWRIFIIVFICAFFIYDCKFSRGQHVSGYITGMAFSIFFADQTVKNKSRDTLVKIIRVSIVVVAAGMALRMIKPPLSSASSWKDYHAQYKIDCRARLNESS